MRRLSQCAAPGFERRRAPPSLQLRLREKSEGARDAGVRVAPRTSTSRDIEASGGFSAASPPFLRPPARGVWACSVRPRRTDFSGPLSLVRSSGLSTAVGPLRHLPVETVLRHRLQGSGAAKLSLRDLTAWADAVRWVCVLHPCAATASQSRLTTPREAPSDGPACAEIWDRWQGRG
jgi:hypothetical protein